MIEKNKLKKLYEKLMVIPNPVYDQIIREVYTNILEPGDTAIDVGANTGNHTLPMVRKVAPQGKIIVFEPITANLIRLNKRLEASGLKDNVQIFQCAVSNFSGESEFTVFNDHPGISCFKERPWYKKENTEKIIVKVETLDQMITPEMEDKIIFMKIDAEGADLHVMQGGRRLIENKRPVIVFESGRFDGVPAKLYNYTQEEFEKFFADLDYKLYNTIGFKYHAGLWKEATLNDYFAIPSEQEEEIAELIQWAAMEVLSEKTYKSFCENGEPPKIVIPRLLDDDYQEHASESGEENTKNEEKKEKGGETICQEKK